MLTHCLLMSVFLSLAYIEMRMILVRMVFNFDMELDQPEKDWMDQQVFFLWDKPELMIKLKSRAHFQ